MLKSEALRAFVVVAECGSFTLAARQLEVSVMAVSKQVSGLEAKLNQGLLVRTTRRLHLTEFGREFLLRAQQILAQHQALDEWLLGGPDKVAGTLSVVSQSAQTYEETVLPYMAEFHQKYPQLIVKLDLREQVLDVEQHQYDIYWGVSDYLGEQHTGLKRRIMWQAPYGIFASKGYLKKFGVPKTPDDLDNHQMISQIRAEDFGYLVVNSVVDSTSTEFDYRQMPSSIQSACNHTQLALQDLGLFNAMADNNDIVHHLATGELVAVLKPYWYQPITAYIYYHQVKFEQAKVRAFIDFFMSKSSEW